MSDTPTAKLAVIALTRGGRALAARLAAGLTAEVVDPRPLGLAATVAQVWPGYSGMIMIMASGIVVRAIAPLLADKRHDPAVVVVEEGGRFAISLVSGHLGGANDLARRVAELCGGQAVITTASDTLGHTALDLWARQYGLVLSRGSLTAASAALVNRGRLTVFTDLAGKLPGDFVPVDSPGQAELIVSNRLTTNDSALAVLCPPNLAMGIGCNRGTSADQIEQAARDTCRQNDLDLTAVGRLGSIDVKQDETGLLEFAGRLGLTPVFYTATELNSVPGLTPSAAVQKATGAQGVAEPAALLLAGADTLRIRKSKWKDVTIAVAEIPMQLAAAYR